MPAMDIKCIIGCATEMQCLIVDSDPAPDHRLLQEEVRPRPRGNNY